MTARLILFDFDGVLCDSRELAIEGVETLRQTPAFAALPSPRLVGHFGELYRGELRHALRPFKVTDEEAREFFGAHASSMRERVDDLVLFEGVREGLDRLPGGSFAIITSAYSTAVQAVLGRGGVDTSTIEIIGHEVRETKTEKARSLLVRRNLEPDDAVYVGDMESDVAYCDALGLRCVGVTYGYHPRHLIEAARPFDIAGSPAELFRILQKELAI